MCRKQQAAWPAFTKPWVLFSAPYKLSLVVMPVDPRIKKAERGGLADEVSLSYIWEFKIWLSYTSTASEWANSTGTPETKAGYCEHAWTTPTAAVLGEGHRCSFFSTSKEPLVGQAPCARSDGLPVTESGVKTRFSGVVYWEWCNLSVHRLTIKNEEILLALPIVAKNFVVCDKGFLKKTKCQTFVTIVDDKLRIPWTPLSWRLYYVRSSKLGKREIWNEFVLNPYKPS